MMNAPLTDALAYLDRGIACIGVTVKPAAGNTKTVKPAAAWKHYAERLPTQDELERQFKRREVNGVAIIAGAVSGNLAVRDFDTADGYSKWSNAHPELAGTLPTVRTRRGHHVYSRGNRPNIVNLGDGEYRGSGLTIAPSTEHYDWIIPLPKGEMPFVPSNIFTGEYVAEKAECHLSAVSAVSAVSAFSATSTPESIVAATQPQNPGERNQKLFSLARGLKFNAGLAKETPDTLRVLVRQWHQRALPTITTKSFDLTWADFLHAWDRSRYPLGMNVVDQAAASVDPLDLPRVAANYDDETTRRLIGLCHALASLTANQRFFLSSHDAAHRLGMRPMECWRLLKMLVRDGVLDQMEPGNQRRATRYRWRNVQ